MNPEELEIYNSENTSDHIKEMLVEEAEENRNRQVEAKKQDEQEKKMAELDKVGGNMSANDIMSLMNDDMLVERYTKHLTNIFF